MHGSKSRSHYYRIEFMDRPYPGRWVQALCKPSLPTRSHITSSCTSSPAVATPQSQVLACCCGVWVLVRATTVSSSQILRSLTIASRPWLEHGVQLRWSLDLFHVCWGQL